MLRTLVVTGQPPDVGIAYDEQRGRLRNARSNLTAECCGEVGGASRRGISKSPVKTRTSPKSAPSGLPSRSILPLLAPPIGWATLTASASRSRPLSRMAASMICPAAFASSSALWCWKV